jgi:endonuclease III
VKPRSPKGRVREIALRLEPEYADLSCGLNFSTPLELVVATILSAQCTDERVNTVTPALFARFPTVEDYANAAPEEIESIVRSCGFYRNKTKSIQGMARTLVDGYSGEVPATMKELLTLPGVARKTANVVLTHAFGRDEGIAVDTHVQRLSRRLGLTVEEDPVKIERDLMALAPRRGWGRLSDLLIWHGRRVCASRIPACARCVLADFCPSVSRPAS